MLGVLHQRTGWSTMLTSSRRRSWFNSSWRISKKAVMKYQTHRLGDTYSHLKKVRTYTKKGICIRPDPKHFEEVLMLSGLRGCRPASINMVNMVNLLTTMATLCGLQRIPGASSAAWMIITFVYVVVISSIRLASGSA